MKLTPMAWTFASATLIAVGCGGSGSSSSSSTGSQADARDQAVTASCSRLQACGDIGAGKTLPSADQCKVNEQTFWNTTWPTQSCDGKVDGAALQVCLDTINSAECGNTLDVINIAANKCAAAKVCSGGPK